jgi:hypothetical protein
MYQISNEYEKKNVKLIIRGCFLSPRAITSWKINESDLIRILVWQSNVPNIKWTYISREKKKSGKLSNPLRGITLLKIGR